ncbi:4Fe-4S dicluster domain-containing protein [Anaeromyxobacter sp. Fw109-5]|uniref:4Fe-4S dicluster domain-containing protein n=1 Tax=Anaeromyxobacter sp. (strain Fw109-5) TaxID=404589 RepID=UPI0000ED8B93|nr:4Fe-4S dicluster domain-containing protein [Anaeromyxobacter sp. Fw109-5]ABS27239.1 4Fe-4S ferredoxin iron-sulfur binding domain protein [Anaeromyxobacter sp. Fw109-5]
MSNATLIDTTKCIGCRSCQVTCKQWNDMPAERTQLNAAVGLQNPLTLSAKTLCVITTHEVDAPSAPGGLQYAFAKRQCMHCDEPACASACPVTAIHKTKEGPVVYDESKCIGCRYCMWACPWGVPMAEWDSLAPTIQKCDMCHDRALQPAPTVRNGDALSADDHQRFAAAIALPACVKQCPAGALKFGDREELLREARERMAASPGKYVDRIYGEQEAGGTNMLYLASVPFSELGFPEVGNESYPKRSAVALGAVPPAVIGVGAALGGAYALHKRRQEVQKVEPTPMKHAKGAGKAHRDEGHDHHLEFAPVKSKLWTPANVFLAALMAFGGASFIARFALGLGGSTNLSDTWAWGLWIVFDLVWIAVAAGAFATAGLIYVFQRKDLYSIGRSAVLMGLLSYSFVTVTLLADLGLPWHFYQLALNAPEHSAMFEVSWCVGLYVTVLLAEFLPVPFDRWGLKAAMETWKRWSPVYVVAAVSLFVYLMSRNLVYTGLAAATFGFMAWAFRAQPGKKAEPIMLAIAAVTLSTMHQSSLGSLFLLMPDKLSKAWWSPVMPVYFFLSAVAAGTALMVLIEMWIAKGFKRQLRMDQLASLGKIAFWALAVYLAFRVGDLAVRGQLAAALTGPKAGLILVELVAGGILPLALLGVAKLRENPRTLALGAFLATGGIVLNRVNVVVFGMELKGAAPQIAPQSYFPSVVEWGISIGLIAATIFLFGLAVRHMPVLPKQGAAVEAEPERQADAAA